MLYIDVFGSLMVDGVSCEKLSPLIVVEYRGRCVDPRINVSEKYFQMASLTASVSPISSTSVLLRSTVLFSRFAGYCGVGELEDVARVRERLSIEHEPQSAST